jgi:hypothetical protein
MTFDPGFNFFSINLIIFIFIFLKNAELIEIVQYYFRLVYILCISREIFKTLGRYRYFFPRLHDL